MAKEKIKQRLKKNLKRLPDNWISAFVFMFPEYKKKRMHLHNVHRGTSLDVNVIDKLEVLAKSLAPKKSLKKNKSML